MNRSTVKRVISSLAGYRVLIALSVLLAVINVFFTLCIPMLIGDAINLAVGQGNVDFDGIMSKLILTLFSAIAAGSSLWLMNVINNRVSFCMVRDLREAAIRKLQRLPISYLDTHAHGDTVSRIITDCDQFADGMLIGFTQLFTGIATIIGTLIFMLALNKWITLAVVVMTPLSLFIARFIASRTYSMFRRQTETRGEQTAFCEEIVSNEKIVKAYSQEENSERKFNEINERLRKHSLSAIFFSSLVNPTTRFINSLIYAVVALIGSILALGGGAAITVGGLASMLSYVSHYTKPFNEISGVIAELQGSFAAVARIFNLLDAEEETPDSAATDDIGMAEGNFDIKDVFFSYTPDRELIKDFNLSVKSGRKVAIVGPTGCGKTTVINLIMRFYEPDSGAILLDGKNISDLPRHSLRKNYGMVLQETWLKSGTVRDNIRFGDPDATDEQVAAAAKAAHAHGFIMRLPDGYDTYITEDGGSLSQGQKQLLCISRVMLRLPPVLILDEATSSIDTMTEQRIQSAFAKLTEGKTSFIVAHRLSTVKNADIILVMKDGNVIEHGTHAELLKKGGFYYTLYNSQFAK